MKSSPDPSIESSDPLEYFALARTIRKQVKACSSEESLPPGDIFYLWLQLGMDDQSFTISEEQWLNVIDEAASLGVNWLVITLGDAVDSLTLANTMCLWAQQTYEMTVCVHTSQAGPSPELESVITTLPRDHTYVLVEPEFADEFEDLRAQGVRVGLANPAPHEGEAACDFPYKMVFVDASGNLYTCGLVAGEEEFLLGSVFRGSLDQIVHNPGLPHSVNALGTRPKQGCSGCPPLVAKYLCQK